MSTHPDDCDIGSHEDPEVADIRAGAPVTSHDLESWLEAAIRAKCEEDGIENGTIVTFADVDAEGTGLALRFGARAFRIAISAVAINPVVVMVNGREVVVFPNGKTVPALSGEELAFALTLAAP